MRVALLVFLVGAGMLAACRRETPRATGPLPHEIYVWQRAHRPALSDALTAHARAFESVIVLAAEVSWRKSSSATTANPAAIAATVPDITRVAINWKPLALSARRVGLAIRVNAFSGPFSADDATSRALVALSQQLLADATAHGVTITELQLDFDAATSKLAGYREWLRELRPALAPVPLVFTALPTWLHSDDFRPLAEAADSFVLQVHSLERPASRDAAFLLCDPIVARRAIERAARVGVPFRVALPTYSYLFAFDTAGRFAGLSAEGPRPQWDASFTLREARADPASLAQLVAELQASRPATLTGLVWYRLPIATDTLNWSWPTLAAVMQGRAPRAQLEVSAETRDGLSRFTVRNTGDDDLIAPLRLAVRWSDARLIAADGQNGFAISDETPDSLQLTSVSTRLPPQSALRTGWLRLSSTQVSPHVTLAP